MYLKECNYSLSNDCSKYFFLFSTYCNLNGELDPFKWVCAYAMQPFPFSGSFPQMDHSSTSKSRLKEKSMSCRIFHFVNWILWQKVSKSPTSVCQSHRVSLWIASRSSKRSFIRLYHHFLALLKTSWSCYALSIV